jgi:hypothetical protein
MTLQEAVEGLYDLSGDELRHLAWEALLISDGPDCTPENMPTENSSFVVRQQQAWQQSGEQLAGFQILGKDSWETATETVEVTPT